MRPVLVQGIIDCLFEDEKGLVLVDYKTDGITDRFKGGFEEARPILEKRYKVQIDLYTKAIEQIYKVCCGKIFVFLRWCPSFKIRKIKKPARAAGVLFLYRDRITMEKRIKHTDLLSTSLIVPDVWLVD